MSIKQYCLYYNEGGWSGNNTAWAFLALAFFTPSAIFRLHLHCSSQRWGGGHHHPLTPHGAWRGGASSLVSLPGRIRRRLWQLPIHFSVGLLLRQMLERWLRVGRCGVHAKLSFCGGRGHISCQSSLALAFLTPSALSSLAFLKDGLSSEVVIPHG